MDSMITWYRITLTPVCSVTSSLSRQFRSNNRTWEALVAFNSDDDSSLIAAASPPFNSFGIVRKQNSRNLSPRIRRTGYGPLRFR